MSWHLTSGYFVKYCVSCGTQLRLIIISVWRPPLMPCRLFALAPCIISLCSCGICWHAEPFRRQSPAVICGFFFTFIIVASKFIIHTFMLFLHLTDWNQCSWLQPQGSRNDAYNMSLYRPGAACRSNFEWYAYMRWTTVPISIEGIWAQ